MALLTPALAIRCTTMSAGIETSAAARATTGARAELRQRGSCGEPAWGRYRCVQIGHMTARDARDGRALVMGTPRHLARPSAGTTVARLGTVPAHVGTVSAPCEHTPAGGHRAITEAAGADREKFPFGA